MEQCYFLIVLIRIKPNVHLIHLRIVEIHQHHRIPLQIVIVVQKKLRQINHLQLPPPPPPPHPHHHHHHHHPHQATSSSNTTSSSQPQQNMTTTIRQYNRNQNDRDHIIQVDLNSVISRTSTSTRYLTEQS